MEEAVNPSYSHIVDPGHPISQHLRGHSCLLGNRHVASASSYHGDISQLFHGTRIDHYNSGLVIVLTLRHLLDPLEYSVAGPSSHDVLVTPGHSLHNPPDLLHCLPLAEDDLGHTFPDGAVVVNSGIAQILEGELSELIYDSVQIHAATLHLLQQVPQVLDIHHPSPSSMIRLRPQFVRILHAPFIPCLDLSQKRMLIFKKEETALEKTLSIISATPFFSGLPQSQLKELKKIAVDRSFNKGEVIFFEGDDANGFYVVVSGLVKVFKISSEGKEHILHIIGPGEPLGEVAVFSGRQFPANAEALARSHLLFFPRTSFVDLIASSPSLALNMLAVLSRRLREFTVQIEHLSLKGVSGRLAAYLIYLADEQGRDDAVSLTISKGQLASLLGTIPETLSRILARMSRQKLIEVKGQSIRLIDRSGLEELAEVGRYAE